MLCLFIWNILTRFDRPKSTGSEVHGWDQESDGTLRQMPHCTTKPPHPGDRLITGGSNHPVLRDRPDETGAQAPAGPDAYHASHSAPAAALLPERPGSYVL